MAIADRTGLPVAVTIASASLYEVTLVGQTLNASFCPTIRNRLFGDAAASEIQLSPTSASGSCYAIGNHRHRDKWRVSGVVCIQTDGACAWALVSSGSNHSRELLDSA